MEHRDLTLTRVTLVVEDYIIGTLQKLLGGQLIVHTGKNLITRSIVANHQTSDTFLDVEIDTHSAVHQRVESVLKKDSGFEQHIGSRRGRSKMLKIGENAGVDKTVELLQLVRITENNRSHDALINQTLRRQHLGRVKQPSHLLAEERVVVITSRHSIGFKTRNTELGKNI